MSRYIDADLALELKDKDMNYVYDLTDLEDFLAGVPTADVEEVRHGYWKRYGQDGSECSLCGKVNTNCLNNNFCPNCGADMRGEKNVKE